MNQARKHRFKRSPPFIYNCFEHFQISLHIGDNVPIVQNFKCSYHFPLFLVRKTSRKFVKPSWSLRQLCYSFLKLLFKSSNFETVLLIFRYIVVNVFWDEQIITAHTIGRANYNLKNRLTTKLVRFVNHTSGFYAKNNKKMFHYSKFWKYC